jgi:RNase P/RNase MRP subunit p29
MSTDHAVRRARALALLDATHGVTEDGQRELTVPGRTSDAPTAPGGAIGLYEKLPSKYKGSLRHFPAPTNVEAYVNELMRLPSTAPLTPKLANKVLHLENTQASASVKKARIEKARQRVLLRQMMPSRKQKAELRRMVARESVALKAWKASSSSHHTPASLSIRLNTTLDAGGRVDATAGVSAPPTVGYSACCGLHELWLQYITNLLQLPDRVGLAGTLACADLHGARLTVCSSKCKGLVGLGGIVVTETKNAFRVVSPDGRIRLLPKTGNHFEMEVEGKLVRLNGDLRDQSQGCDVGTS